MNWKKVYKITMWVGALFFVYGLTDTMIEIRTGYLPIVSFFGLFLFVTMHNRLSIEELKE